MAQNPKPSRSKHIGDNEVQEITNASNRALTALFDKLNSVLAGPEGKFFPNGIELIAFDITVGEKSNPAVSISVKVATTPKQYARLDVI